MYDQYAEMYMHDRCMTYVVNIGRTTDYATQESRQSHDIYLWVSSRKLVQNG